MLCVPLFAVAAAQEALPTGAAILERYVEVTGGRAAYANRKTEVRTISMEVKGRDLRFTAVSYRARPDRMYTVTEIPGMGKVEEGVGESVAWSLSDARGAVVKQGAEREFALYGANMDAEANWKEWFPKVETAGTEEFEGRTCYKVLLTDPSGEQHSRWYDKQTGYLAKLVLQVKLQQGQFPMEMRLYDYREAGGVIQAHRVLRIMPGQEMESRVDKIEANVEIDPARFVMPDAVKALAEKKGGS
jgi:hypothetical protein